jgi:hypothetical protein
MIGNKQPDGAQSPARSIVFREGATGLFQLDPSRALVVYDGDGFAAMERRSFSRNMDCVPVGRETILRGPSAPARC